MLVAFDFDGTLCNIEHRLHYIQGAKKDWPAFFAACIHDVPISALINTAISLAGVGHKIEIWSGRSDEVREQSEAWLDARGVPYKVLRMRSAGDHRPDWQVKEEWLHSIPAEFRPVLAFDDRQQVVDMWRRNGVICCQVAPGNF